MAEEGWHYSDGVQQAGPSAEWFYDAGDERRGPITESELRGMLARAELQPNQLVWRAGMARREPAESAGLLAPAPALAAIAYASRGSEPQFASFGERLLAWLIDWFIVGGVRFVAIMVIGIPAVIFEDQMDASETLQMWFGIVAIVLLYLCGLLYYALMEASSKQATVGKMALSIRVADIEGGPPSLTQTVVRYILRLFSALLLGFGYLLAAFTARRQALHDIGANCIVLRKAPRA